LAASLVGCSCFVSPQSGIEACTGADGRGFACFDKNVPAARLSQAEPESSSFDPGATRPREKSALAARTAKPASGAGGKTRHAEKAVQSATAVATAVDSTAAAKAEPAAAGQPPAIDPVIDKAKIAVAAKLEDPASAAFGEMNRSMRKNTLGQSVDTICGRVKSKKASGEGVGDRPFLYLVKDDEAYVADGSPTSAASTAYRNICN
jgi:hypothetical protein